MIYITKESEFVKRSDNGLVYYLTKAINTGGELLIVLDAPLISDYSINAKSIQQCASRIIQAAMMQA